MAHTTDLLRSFAISPVQARRTRHTHFLRYSTREDKHRRKKIDRITSTRVDDGVVLLDQETEYVLETKVSFYPEYAAFTHNLEGCPRQLLTYLLFHELNYEKGTYRFNQQTVARFKEYMALMGGKQYTDSTIQKANRILVEQNIAQSVRRGIYMINPLIAGGCNQDVRRMLINDYSQLLLKKGKHPILHFLPVYDEEATDPA